ncbi:MAG: HAD hydrolase-like protein [Rikenellaceae bacterium]|nr:HAD hydrolase-like protein [Rikenellaceae bacterium]MBP3682148.1 HAD hydrolase-like protein [Rikenellaceae bacterium]
MHRKLDYDWLLFDLDGTLTDPFEGITRSVEYALNAFGIEVEDRRVLAPFIGPPLVESLTERYGFTMEDAVAAVAKYREYFAVKGLYENELFEGIPELLSDCRKAGYKISMATSKPTHYARIIAEHFDIARYFDAIHGSSLDGTRITKSSVVAEVVAEEHLDPSRALMIGDRRHDVEGAGEHGIRTVGVLYGYGSREEHEAAGAAYIVNDLDELRELLICE